eukprot:359468-Chlamydomonas_euryale.AAC.1
MTTPNTKQALRSVRRTSHLPAPVHAILNNPLEASSVLLTTHLSTPVHQLELEHIAGLRRVACFAIGLADVAAVALRHHLRSVRSEGGGWLHVAVPPPSYLQALRSRPIPSCLQGPGSCGGRNAGAGCTCACAGPTRQPRRA